MISGFQQESFSLLVGQACSLRRIFNPPGAGPAKLFGRNDQSGLDRIQLDVTQYAPELRSIPDNAVVTFFLPESLTRQVQHLVRLPGGEPFESMRQLRYRNAWGN